MKAGNSLCELEPSVSLEATLLNN